MTRPSTGIEGAVIDSATREPIVGANVTVQPTNIAALTDENGHFRLVVPPGHYQVTAYFGDAAAPHDVEIGAGQMKTVDLELPHELLVQYEPPPATTCTAAVDAPAPTQADIDGVVRAALEHLGDRGDTFAPGPVIVTAAYRDTVFRIARSTLPPPTSRVVFVLESDFDGYPRNQVHVWKPEVTGDCALIELDDVCEVHEMYVRENGRWTFSSVVQWSDCGW